MTLEEVQAKVWEALSTDARPGHGMIPQAMAPYWQGHKPRFDLQVKWFIETMAGEKIERVLDVGTGFPFATAYWALHGANVIYGCPAEMPDSCAIPNTQYVRMNLCRPLPVIEQFDLVVCTECLEHLPCNLYKARNRLMDAVRRGGFLLLSFPLGGANACNYHHDNPAAYDTISDPHIREFTDGGANDFALQTGFDMICNENIFSPAYGGVIKNVLLRRTE